MRLPIDNTTTVQSLWISYTKGYDSNWTMCPIVTKSYFFSCSLYLFSPPYALYILSFDDSGVVTLDVRSPLCSHVDRQVETQLVGRGPGIKMIQQWQHLHFFVNRIDFIKYQLTFRFFWLSESAFPTRRARRPRSVVSRHLDSDSRVPRRPAYIGRHPASWDPFGLQGTSLFEVILPEGLPSSSYLDSAWFRSWNHGHGV